MTEPQPTEPSSAGIAPSLARPIALLLLIGLALGPFLPGSLAATDPAGTELYTFGDGGTVFLETRYADGVGSTRMTFIQLAGADGGPGQRLEPTPECTEWIGTFTQIFVSAERSETTADATLRLGGELLSTPPSAQGDRDEPGWVLDVLGGPGAWEGSLLVCDDPDGQGLVRFRGTVQAPPLVDTQPGLVKLTPEAA